MENKYFENLYPLVDHLDEPFIEAVHTARIRVGECKVSKRYRGYYVWVMKLYWTARTILRDKRLQKMGLSVDSIGDN